MTVTTRVKTLPVIEIFGPTIQGEGIDAGRPCYFVRFGGCDYRCSWCDSMHAVDPKQVRENKSDLTAGQITAQVLSLPGSAEWVIFSGGNPALHDLTELIELLQGAALRISVETQGSRWKDWLRECDIVCVSPKGPSAEMQNKFSWDALDMFNRNLFESTARYFYKVPLFNEADIAFLRHLRLRYPEAEVMASIGNSWAPGSDVVERRDGAQPETEMQFKERVLLRTRYMTERLLHDPVLGQVRVIPQLHTLLWGNEKGR